MAMKKLSELQKQFYEEFKGLPSFSPIVRNNQENDAFELVVLKILYGKNLPDFNKSNATEFSKFIIAPPDSGIDIFYQHENGDECSFDVIQVKHTALDESEIRTAILGMKRTIEDFCKSPKLVSSDSCREVLSKSSLEKTNKTQCHYYVVHTGEADNFSGSQDDETVLTSKNLEILYNNINEAAVDNDTIDVDTSMKYGCPEDSHGAIVCSINGYDLATLNNNYYNTEVGRNILFGSNLRESLITKKSKPYLSMSKTIQECPQNFWYYNNGITIIAEDAIFDKENQNKITLKNFSIVNGAQTTSSLGLFLKEAKKNADGENIENLKKVFVLARILRVTDKQMWRDIAIFNNTQNPITSRDKVANRIEQIHLNEWLLDDTYPQIYVEIRRGAQIPSGFNKGFIHRKTSNEELAQLLYSSFLQKPFMAKDKKSALFNDDFSQSEFTINKIYHDIFHWDKENADNNGVAFTKKKTEIDELLFVQHLYKEAKRLMKSTLTERISRAQEQKENTTNIETLKSIEARINQNAVHLDAVGICMFYVISLYYEFKAQFDSPSDIRYYDYDKFYSDKDYKQRLIESFANLFLTLTVKIIVKTAAEANKSGNINNWVRGASCEEKFFSALRDELASDFEYEQKYQNYLNEFKK